jgi:hypothetical protein
MASPSRATSPSRGAACSPPARPPPLLVVHPSPLRRFSITFRRICDRGRSSSERATLLPLFSSGASPSLLWAGVALTGHRMRAASALERPLPWPSRCLLAAASFATWEQLGRASLRRARAAQPRLQPPCVHAAQPRGRLAPPCRWNPLVKDVNDGEERFEPMTCGSLLSLYANMDLGAFIWVLLLEWNGFVGPTKVGVSTQI